MKKKEKIDSLMNFIKNNKKLNEVMLGISNDECLSEGNTDLEQRNDLFIFLGVALSLLAYSEIIIFNNEVYYRELNQNKKYCSLLSKQVSGNKTLINLISNIINNEINKEESRVRYHIFLLLALITLSNRNIITINKNSNNKSPY